MLVTANCTPSTILLKAGNPTTTQTLYIYKTAYVAPSGSSSWTPVALFGSSLISGAWYQTTAQGVTTIQDTSTPTYYVAYTLCGMAVPGNVDVKAWPARRVIGNCRRLSSRGEDRSEGKEDESSG
jgi:hypothetical protein